MEGLPEIKIDLGNAVPYLWEKVLQKLGRDAATLSQRQWFHRLQHIGFETASTLQLIGMHTPIPFGDVYRPTRLILRSAHNLDPGDNLSQAELEEVAKSSPFVSHRLNGLSHEEKLAHIEQEKLNERLKKQRRDIQAPQGAITPTQFTELHLNAIVTAGPGWGKTTLLHHLFLEHIAHETVLPILITLRRKSSIADLEKLLKFADLIKRKHDGPASDKFLLLVDGYDEISPENRVRVSSLINEFIAMRIGKVLLACRQYYDIYDLKLPYIHIAPFSETDQQQYVYSFMKAYGDHIDPITFIADLRQGGLGNLLGHPLLLALICIVRSESQSIRSRNVLGLIERALDTLMFRWDRSKLIVRDQATPLDGRTHLHIMMRIAGKSLEAQVSARMVAREAREQLDKLRWDDLDENTVMLEIARFYGILVPVDDTSWGFVHKTLQDYLAARYINEHGGLANIDIKDWIPRYAYAACLSLDATRWMQQLLGVDGSLEVFTEMLSNDAEFDQATIADALLEWHKIFPDLHYYSSNVPHGTFVQLAKPFLGAASSRFLRFLLIRCSAQQGRAEETFLGYSLFELRERKVPIPEEAGANLRANYRRYGRLFIYLDKGWVAVPLHSE